MCRSCDADKSTDKPNTMAGGAVGAAGAVAGRSQSTPKKSTDVDGAVKDPKSRSTSRGMLDRFKQKSDVKEEKKAEKALPKHDKEAEKLGEAAVPAAVVGGGAGVLDARSTGKSDSLEFHNSRLTYRSRPCDGRSG